MEAKYFTTDKIIAIGLVGFLGGKVAGKDLHRKVQKNTEGK
nr:MAG TPA: hypothetical protein [Caudoviricetes sp.]